jgi:hypothetical protein
VNNPIRVTVTTHSFFYDSREGAKATCFLSPMASHTWKHIVAFYWGRMGLRKSRVFKRPRPWPDGRFCGHKRTAIIRMYVRHLSEVLWSISFRVLSYWIACLWQNSMHKRPCTPASSRVSSPSPTRCPCLFTPSGLLSFFIFRLFIPAPDSSLCVCKLSGSACVFSRLKYTRSGNDHNTILCMQVILEPSFIPRTMCWSDQSRVNVVFWPKQLLRGHNLTMLESNVVIDS